MTKKKSAPQFTDCNGVSYSLRDRVDMRPEDNGRTARWVRECGYRNGIVTSHRRGRVYVTFTREGSKRKLIVNRPPEDWLRATASP